MVNRIPYDQIRRGIGLNKKWAVKEEEEGKECLLVGVRLRKMVWD